MPTAAASFTSPRRVRTRRLSVAFLIGAVVVLWIVLAFGRALISLNEAHDRAAALRAENAALQMRLQQGQAEMELAQTDAFQRMLARGMGMAPAGEEAFALEDGAPPPPTVAPLGADPAAERAPLEAWLSLLFGD
jgi:outer membrane murein-binding lipoprotein Lpp